MVMFSGSGNESIERRRLLRHNIEHCEMYWKMGYDKAGDDVAVLLVDCTDNVGLMISQRMVGPERSSRVIADCMARGVIPTLHASMPLANIAGYLRAIGSKLSEPLERCPSDCFPIVVIGDGGMSLAYRERPTLTEDHSHSPKPGA